MASVHILFSNSSTYFSGNFGLPAALVSPSSSWCCCCFWRLLKNCVLIKNAQVHLSVRLPGTSTITGSKCTPTANEQRQKMFYIYTLCIYIYICIKRQTTRTTTIKTTMLWCTKRQAKATTRREEGRRSGNNVQQNKIQSLSCLESHNKYPATDFTLVINNIFS